MIAMGGVIGAGLFVGSGVVIGSAGPGAFLSYAITGPVDHHGDADARPRWRWPTRPRARSPTTPVTALGGWAGFSDGWLYWYFWVIVVGFEAIAGAKIVQYWCRRAAVVVARWSSWS